MQKAKRQARPRPDDPVQSERFMKDAADLMTADGGQLFERAMETLARPQKLPKRKDEAIIETLKSRQKKTGGD